MSFSEKNEIHIIGIGSFKKLEKPTISPQANIN